MNNMAGMTASCRDGFHMGRAWVPADSLRRAGEGDTLSPIIKFQKKGPIQDGPKRRYQKGALGTISSAVMIKTKDT
jgi:hypothetical protein